MMTYVDEDMIDEHWSCKNERTTTYIVGFMQNGCNYIVLQDVVTTVLHEAINKFNIRRSDTDCQRLPNSRRLINYGSLHTASSNQSSTDQLRELAYAFQQPVVD